jgi:flagellar biogenesis protein FliO
VSPVAQYIVQAGLTLVGIALLAYLLLIAGRRWSKFPTKGPLELVGRLPLEGRRAVYLVRVDKTILVLGATDQNIAKLGEMSADQLGPELAPPRKDFASLWERATARGEPASEGPNTEGTAVSSSGSSSGPKPGGD